jgi:hypothetical protein
MSHDATGRAGQRGAEVSRAQPSDPVIGKQTRVEALEIGASPTSAAPAPVQRAAAGTDAPPDQIREAAALGTRGAGGSLPHIGDIQRLFGRHDVSGVVAHTDADAARGAGAMGAQAFATGGHVAFDGQPSLHTAAHEAAHVVQQRGGVQLYGGIGATGDVHEQHADAVADRVVTGESAEPLLDRHAGAGPAAGPAGAAVQRMVTQIVPRPDHADVIQRVVVVGRPERSHGASMGDHSTAFTLHVEGIRTQLQGKTLTEAVGELDALVRAARGLPGFSMIAGLPDEKRVKVEDKWTAQLQVRSRPVLGDPGSADAAALALDLQDYINAYLEFREVIPMSTINVAAKSPATAGKGKGESADALVRKANGEAVPAHELLAAIAKLFDARGAAIVAAEPLRDMLAKLAPGVDPGLDYRARMTRVVEQHVGSVAASFPSVFAADSGVTRDAVRATLEVQILPLVLESWNGDLRAWQKRVNRLSDQAGNSRAEAVVAGGKKARAAAQADAVRLEAEANDWRAEISRTQAQITELDELLPELLSAAQDRGGLVAPTAPVAPADPHVMDVDGGAAPSSTPHAATADHGAMDVDDGAPGPSTPSTASPSAAPGATDGGAAAGQDSEPDDERKQPLATQLKLASDGTIAEVISAGRSPSPFSGTMGAHTTSWVVHLDRIRRAVTGKTVADAVVALGPVLAEADAMLAKLTDVFPIRRDHQRSLDTARSSAVDALDRGPRATPQTRPALLQQAINELLTYINYIPGATLEAADTGGKVEGMHRGTLRAAESGAPIPPRELREAILNLLDIKAATQPEQRAALVDNHLDLIQATYPRALARAIRSEVEDMALDYLDRRDDGDARSNGATARRPNAKRSREGASQTTAKRRRAGDPGATTSLPGSSAAAPRQPPMTFDFTAFGAIDESAG